MSSDNQYNVRSPKIERYGTVICRWSASCYINDVYYVGMGITINGAVRDLWENVRYKRLEKDFKQVARVNLVKGKKHT